MDTCGFPKDNFWYYKACWTHEPVVHVLPHWNWPGMEGRAIDVRVFTNCDVVELTLNGRPLGRQAVVPYAGLKWAVIYAPGTLVARGYRAGRLAAVDTVETTGAPAAVRLTPDRAAIGADGKDLAVFTVSVVDAQGRIVPLAGDRVSFEVVGPGHILGVGNGDPSCHEPDTLVAAAAHSSVQVGGWRSAKVADPYPENLPEEGVAFDDSKWKPVDAAASTGDLGSRGRAVYRAHLTAGAAELAAPVSELWFGSISGGVAVYVNGRRVGGACDANVPSVYDVKGLLHPGDNVIAVAAANYGIDPSGLSGGVTLRTQESASAPAWSRSVFNGLAQVLVQGTREPGRITITARSGSLEPATFALETRASP